MLVLSRRQGESIVIGGDVRVTVVGISGSQVKLSIDAPRSVSVHRNEVWEAIRKENEEAASGSVGEVEGGAGPGTITSLEGGSSLDDLVAGSEKVDEDP